MDQHHIEELVTNVPISNVPQSTSEGTISGLIYRQAGTGLQEMPCQIQNVPFIPTIASIMSFF